MSLRHWSVVLVTLTALAGGLRAQPPGQFQPRPDGAGPRTGIRQEPLPPPGIRLPPPNGRIAVPEPGPDQVDDFRNWVLGKKPAAPKDIDPKVLKDFMNEVGKMPKGKQPDQQQIEKLLKDNPQFKDPAFLEQLKKMVDSKDFPGNLQKKLYQPPDGPPPMVPGNKEELAEKFKKVLEGAEHQTGPPHTGPKSDGPQGEPKLPQTGPDGLPKPDPAEQEWAKWAQKTFGDSPALQDAIKDLASSMDGPDGKGLFGDLSDFKGDDLFKDLDLKGSPGEGFKIRPPDMDPGWTGPKVGETGGGGPLFGGGGSSGGGGGAPEVGAGGGTALAVIAGLVGAIFLAVLLMRKWQLNREAARVGAHATHGPLDFSGVRTREQLVEAFDTVSLDQIGDEARAWNHRVIADQIADARPAVAEPAAELGRMYEVARYAPPDEDLPPTDYADARKGLSVIAGVPA
jgi:hypothetical protein